MSRFGVVAAVMLGLGCAHPPSPAPGVPSSSREQLAQALRERGFLAADAPPGTQLGGSIRQFQKSQGLEETGFPDRQTLTRLGIDPDTIDSSLDWRTKNIEGATGAGVSH
jgi:peptidoglycan hydrolase-like protein with peptidoglycan-binding domain